ncbi:hypothetical protein D9O36_02480 [Zobellia amurskyensis]|uniref:Type VI secretion system (T6SS) VasB/ImpH family protein n=1 Tax=Zobellia amurskyensis TaxID=248905 RepID=A0A7X2ZQU4_9FLAO|nr:hypothetical protein [Zobellia amurskyensis]MUH34697.1 hypothetical protein [Zobellia amurskyensis]
MNGISLESIFTELSSVYENLRAETIIAEIQENSEATISDFVIANKGTFSRAYRRDIINIDDVLHDNKLTINLSRNGLYDILPEGLFHVPHVSNGTESYTAKRKVVKQEEQDARLFFAPLENEFFYQRLQVEQNEKSMLNNFYNLKDDFLINFWSLDINIPHCYILKIIKLLPYSHKIVGDLELTRLCLEKILEEKVSFKRRNIGKTKNTSEDSKEHSKDIFQLGVNSVLEGNSYEVLSPLLEVIIGPIQQDKISLYSKTNGVSRFIDTFYDYFLPMELETDTIITVKKEVGFVLNDTLNPLMGISTYL